MHSHVSCCLVCRHAVVKSAGGCCRWTAAVGWRLLFGINGQTRRRFNGRNDTYWDSSNALDLLDYTVSKGYSSNLDFEFGESAKI